jgi:hypothetical protein
MMIRRSRLSRCREDLPGTEHCSYYSPEMVFVRRANKEHQRPGLKQGNVYTASGASHQERIEPLSFGGLLSFVLAWTSMDTCTLLHENLRQLGKT